MGLRSGFSVAIIVMIKKIIKEMVILSTLSVATALVVNSLSPVGLPLTRSPAVFSTTATSFPIIDVTTAKELLDNDASVFVDARSQDQYQQGHIPGAVLLPAYNLDEYIFPFLDTYPMDTALVAYCSNKQCGDSHLLADELAAAGYRNIRIFSGGIDAWQAGGYAVENAY